MIYTVTLSPALDYILRLDNLCDNDINRAKFSEILYGGKGINVSVLLSRLGVENIALGFTAGFTGKELQRLLSKDSVKTDFVYLKEGNTRINVKIFAKTQMDINAPAPVPSSDEISSLYAKLFKLKKDDILVLAGSVPTGIDAKIYEEMLKILEPLGAKAVVDTTGSDLLSVLKFKPFLVKPNHHELGEIFSVTISPDDEKSIELYGKKLQAMGAKNVLVSRGKYGATLIDENGQVNTASVVPGKPINNVGCGDSMVAGFIAGYNKTHNFKEALMLASAAGNATAFCEGIAQKENVMKIKEQYFS